MNLNGKVSNPGDLRTKVGLYALTVTTLPGGFKKPSQSKIADAWAKWSNVHGSEAWTASTLLAEQAATVTIRFRSDIDTTCLVEKGGKYFTIVSMDDIQERHEYIEMKVRRWQSG